jgi:broad specificity phosphatase PhoE
LFDGCGVPIVVQAMHSEVLDTSCDIGTQPKLLAEKFTALDFSHLNEHWWNHMKIEEINGKTLMKETKENARRRALEFKKWILERAEKKIVVVGHGAFFKILSESRLKMPNCGYRIMEL